MHSTPLSLENDSIFQDRITYPMSSTIQSLIKVTTMIRYTLNRTITGCPCLYSSLYRTATGPIHHCILNHNNITLINVDAHSNINDKIIIFEIFLLKNPAQYLLHCCRLREIPRASLQGSVWAPSPPSSLASVPLQTPLPHLHRCLYHRRHLCRQVACKIFPKSAC